MGNKIKNIFEKVKSWLAGLSFRTGVVLIVICIVCYIISFAQMLLPTSATTKGVLWVIFFGLAKTFQYSGLAVLGVTGLARLKAHFRKKAQ